MEEKSRLQIALETPLEELTDEQKDLLRENVAALTEEQVATYTEAGILEAAPATDTPSGDTPSGDTPAGDDTPPSGDDTPPQE